MNGMPQQVVAASVIHADAWAQMRAVLWPDGSVADHREDIDRMLADLGRSACFIALAADGTPIGFVEAALRHDYVNGCETSLVVFVEGVYVAAEARRRGFARLLIDAVVQWGRQGCTEMASDADIANQSSHDFHRSVGFAETERVVYFRKLIG